MRIGKILTLIFIMAFSHIAWAQSTSGGHGGHGGGRGSGSDDKDCLKAKISRYQPEHLATVAPGTEFSFATHGSNGPGHIHVTIKGEPVPFNIEDKETFYWVRGKLPADIKNTTVRISVKARAKNPRCDADGGWLVKVSE